MKNELRRLDDDGLLNLPGFSQVPPEQREKILADQAAKLADVQVDLMGKLGKSRVAEQDLHTTINTVNQLDESRKAYHVKEEFETGSGRMKISIRGGDVRFILPILIVVALLILGILVILLKH